MYLTALFIYQYISIFAVFIYTVPWRYKKDYRHASIDILLPRSSASWMFAAVLATHLPAIVPKYLKSNWLRWRQYSPYLYKVRNMTILHCSANTRKKFEMAYSQSPPENLLKRHVLVWVTSTVLIKWKVNLKNFLSGSGTGTPCIDIKTFELNFQLNF